MCACICYAHGSAAMGPYRMHHSMIQMTTELLHVVNQKTKKNTHSYFHRVKRLLPHHAIHTSSSSVDSALQTILFVSPVWPERSSSAAGVRTSDLVSSFIERGSTVHYAASMASHDDASKQCHVEFLKNLGATTHVCQPNREDDFVDVLQKSRPDVVIFDRFYTEEMFSHIVEKHMPNVCRVLDMQDVHFLRMWRQQLVVADSGGDLYENVLMNMPPSSYEPCCRELASIYRSDLTLVCSPREVDMLQGVFGVDRRALVEASFFAHGTMDHRNGSSSDRRDCMMIGNFKHPPNADSVEWTCQDIWPKIRERLSTDHHIPKHELPHLHIYGAYGNKNKFDMRKDRGLYEQLGIEFRGFAPSLDIMSQYLMLLAPLRFGAGLKGKVVDAWSHGLPVVTTVIGSEGMEDPQNNCTMKDTWGGRGGAKNAEDIINDAVSMYLSTPSQWSSYQQHGYTLLKTLYDRERNLQSIHSALDARYKELEEYRNANYLGRMVWSQQMRATEYFSRWVELKEKTRKD
jgi:hypothetical protein